MNKYVVQPDIHEALFKQPKPILVAWNRIEGRPRRTDFSRALKAEIRDPLWLLTRQWQFGEFEGDDAGSPVSAKLAWRTNGVTEVSVDGSTSPYNEAVPLEAEVEALPVPWRQGGGARCSRPPGTVAWPAPLPASMPSSRQPRATQRISP